MTDRIRLGVIFGGRSGEHEVSLMSARSIIATLDTRKYQVTQIYITHDGVWLSGPDALESGSTGRTARLVPVVLIPEPGHGRLYARRSTSGGIKLEPFADLDGVFPALHGTGGEDGSIQGLFEMAGIAYVGAGVLGSAVAMDKGLFKDVMKAHDLPSLDFKVFTRSQIQSDLDQVVQASESLSAYPLFTKPANLGSSVGISKCHNRVELQAGLKTAALYDRRILVEKGIQNPVEVEVSVLGNDTPLVSNPGEIRPSDEFYTYKAKYIDGKSQLLIPAPLSPEITEEIRRLAGQAYQAIDCAGMARIDFLIDPSDQTLYLSEVNSIPGFTHISMYPKLWEASGISFAALIDRLIELAFERKADQDRTERRYGRVE
jgi:D-alanine-D-alanine ligase